VLPVFKKIWGIVCHVIFIIIFLSCHCCIKVTEKEPLYDPDGLASGLPTVSVPPIHTSVRPGDAIVVVKWEPVLAAPICNPIEPPLLPVSVTSGPFIIEITVPRLASISKRAGEKGYPRLANTRLPVDERDPSGYMITVPPEEPWKKAPKISPCAGLAYTAMGLGGGGCAVAVRQQENRAMVIYME
jgi:hypothetical protein